MVSATMLIGYARVSTNLQRLALQIDALQKAGCFQIYADEGVSGGVFNRDGLKDALSELQPSYTLVVWRLDRLGRSLSKLVSLIDTLGTMQVQFRSITENIDNTSSGGRLVFHMMAALAEFERVLISERTRAGLQAARAKGKRIGRPHALTTDQIAQAWAYYIHNHKTLGSIAHQFGIAPKTLRRSMIKFPHSGEADRQVGPCRRPGDAALLG